jgi:hypothetical protein
MNLPLDNEKEVFILYCNNCGIVSKIRLVKNDNINNLNDVLYFCKNCSYKNTYVRYIKSGVLTD